MADRPADHAARPRRSWLVIVLCLVAAAVVVVGALLAARGQDASAEFTGTDAQATGHVEDTGYVPWIQPLLQPGSAEVESGLFALQAAAGGLVLGFVLGTLRERRRATRPASGTR